MPWSCIFVNSNPIPDLNLSTYWLPSYSHPITKNPKITNQGHSRMFSTLHRRAQIAPLQNSNKTIMPCVHIFVNARIPDPKRLSQIPRFQNMLKPTSTTLNPMINVENLNPQTPPSPNLTTTIIHATYIYVPSWSLALQKLTQNSALQIPSWPTDAQCLSVYSCVTEALPHFELSPSPSLSLFCLYVYNSSTCHTCTFVSVSSYLGGF